MYIVLNTIQKYSIKSYDQYLKIIFKDNKLLCYINENIITIFLLLTFYVMELGFIGLLWQQYEISKIIGMLIISGLSYIVLRGNVKSVVKTNVIIMPLLVLVIIYIAISGIDKFGMEEVNMLVEANWIFLINAIIYGSYNFIMLLPLITSLNERNISKKEAKIISVCTFVIIVFLSISILLLLSLFDISKIEIPIIYITNYISNNTVILGVVLVLLAIFTSVICVGYSFLNNISRTKSKYIRNLLIMCLMSFFIVNFSFASTMQVIYTFLGILGIIQILAIILANFRKN